MWQGPGLVDAYGGDTGNLTDLKVKGLVRTVQSDKHSFAYLTELGLELARARRAEGKGTGMENVDLDTVASVGTERDGVPPVVTEKVPTPEQIAFRSRPRLEGLARSYFWATINPGAKVSGWKSQIPTAGDDDLWSALWKAQEWNDSPTLQQHLSNKDKLRWRQIQDALEKEIRYRYLTDPSMAEDLRLPDGTPISAEDFRTVSKGSAGIPTEATVGKVYINAPDDVRERLKAAQAGEAPAATPEADETPLPAPDEVPEAEEATDVAVPAGDEGDVGGPGSLPDPSPEFPGTPVGVAAPGDGGLTGVPAFAASLVKPGDKVYTHPQGSVIIVNPDGNVVKVGPDGKPRKSSATAAKLAVGHGQWAPLEGGAKPAPVVVEKAPPIDEAPITDLTPAEAVVTTSVVEPELPSSPAPTGSKFRAPMIFDEVSVADVPKYIDDDSYFFQQKVDGIRGQLVIEPGKEPWFRSKSGQRLVSSTAAKITGPMLKKLGGQSHAEGPSYTVDGELLDGVWYVFDVAVDGAEKTPWEDRMAVAESWVNEMHKAGITNIQALPTAKTAEQKRALWDAVNASGGEGVMIKRRDAGYNYDKRVSHTVKAKITSTADVIVLERNIGGKENARIGLVINGEEVSIGTVSMQGKEKFGAVNVGDVIEVEYLWAMPGTNALQQPRMVKRRPDKKRSEATADQLRFVDKSVVDVADTTAPTPAPEPEPVVTPEEAPAQPPAAPSPPPVPEADEDPLSAAVAAFETKRPSSPWFEISGDPTSDSWSYTRNSKSTMEGGSPVVEVHTVTRGDDGALTVTSPSGKSYPLSNQWPDLWKAITAGKPKSYEGKEASDSYPAFGEWTDGQMSDLAVDMEMSRRPYPPLESQYNKPTQKERSAYYQAIDYWTREIRERYNAGGPPKVEARVGVDASDEDLEAELARLSKLATAAADEDAKVTDAASNRGLTQMDHYLSGMSRQDVARVSRTAAPLRAEMLRRVEAEVVGDPPPPDPRWDGKDRPSTRALSGMAPDEQKKVRDTYVVKDKNTVDKNASLRSGSPSSAAKTWRTKTDKWIKSHEASTDGVLWRGIAIPPSILRQFKPGAKVTDPGIVSTDQDRSNAEFYLGVRIRTRPDALPVMLEVRTPAGTKVVDADYGEHVFPSNTEMVVRSVYRDGEFYRVVVEVAGGSAPIGPGGGPGGLTAAGLRARVHRLSSSEHPSDGTMAAVEDLRRRIHG